MPDFVPIATEREPRYRENRRIPSLLMRTPTQLDGTFEIEWLAHTGSPICLRWDSTLAL